MKRNELQSKGVDVLKSFNNAISTSRLYPPEAPQVTAAKDRGYKAIKAFLRINRELQFALVDNIPYLCGAPLHQEVLDSFPNLHVYRQLRLLGLNSLRMAADMDRFTFNQLLAVFQASVATIKDKGGGLGYITAQGLSRYFALQPQISKKVSTSASHEIKGVKERSLLKVRPELVACILGQDKRPLVIEDLKKRIVVMETGVSILAASVARILQGIREKKKIVAALEFPQMLLRTEELIDQEKKPVMARQLAQLLIPNLKDSALCVLFCQDFSPSFGAMLYDGLITELPTTRMKDVIIIFREQLRRARSRDAKSALVHILGKSMLKLMNTEKGKLFLSSEKAKNIIHDGERERTKIRLETGLNGVLHCDFQVLESEELVEALPAGILAMQKGDKKACVPKILKNLVVYLGQKKDRGNSTVIQCLLQTGDGLVEGGSVAEAEILAEPFMLLAQRASLGPHLFEQIIQFLQRLMKACWKTGSKALGDKILLLFFQIRSGQIQKNDQLKIIVGQVQDREIDRASLPQFLADCLASPKDETLSYRLALQGPVAISFLVDSLIHTEGSIDRLKIIDLLTYNPKHLPVIIHEQLPKHMPWYGKRNLIKLLAETGKAEDAQAVLGYLRHVDFRVQREAFLCIYKIGGPYRKRLFLEALDIASESVTVQIVEAFSAFCDQEVVTRLGVLMSELHNFSEAIREPLLLALLDTFGRCPCSASVRAVQNLLESKDQKTFKKLSRQVWDEAEKTLHFLKNDLQAMKRKHLQASQLRKNAMKQLGKKNKSSVSQRVITGLPEEQVIKNLLSKGEQAQAINQLMLLIEQRARARNFLQAQQLKEWLAEIEPKDMTPVLKAGEIIAREKIENIDSGHLEVWSKLYDALTTQEFSEVFEHLEHKKYLTEESIVKQGEVQNALFFVNSGEVKVYYKDEGNDFLIKTMHSGEIFGADAFFESSVWTMSVASVGDSNISSLQVDTRQRWAKEFPKLEEKLLRFCEQFERVESLIIKSSKDRRVHKRHQFGGTVSTVLIDSRGRSTGITADVQMMDISQGGLAYKIKIDQKDNLRQLLGRIVQMDLPTGEEKNSVTKVAGGIVAVKKCKEDIDYYSLHMKFNDLLDPKKLYDIIQAGRMDSAMSPQPEIEG
jgi:CRP-like cAMP-binding protein